MSTNHDQTDSTFAAGARRCDVLKLAEERARRADADLIAAETAVADAEAALAAVAASDPKAFEREAARRDEARRHRDEARGRAAFAQRAADAERNRAKDEESAALRAELEIVEGHLRAGDEEIVRECLKFIAELREAFGLQRDFSRRAARLDVQLGRPPRHDRSYFANIPVGSEIEALLNHLEIQREAMTAAQKAKEEETP